MMMMLTAIQKEVFERESIVLLQKFPQFLQKSAVLKDEGGMYKQVKRQHKHTLTGGKLFLFTPLL